MKNFEFVALNMMRFGNKRKKFRDMYKSLLKEELYSLKLDNSEIELAYNELEKARGMGIRIITFNSDEYPESLKHIPDSPIVLYAKGDSLNISNISVSIVGSRKCSQYGRNAAYKFAKDFASYGITVISGLAVGIDSSAHLGSIDGKGKTIAVIGSGLDRVYPASNKQLADRVISSGSLISEFPLGTKPEKYNFPFRNRIISGLSLATIVVEAAKKSGSLITARLAAEQGKDVFAVPGNITSRMSEGTNALIKDGAIPATCTDDILTYVKELKTDNPQLENVKKPVKNVTPEEKLILSIMENSAETIDNVSLKNGISVSKLIAVLTYMEVKGLIKRNGGRYIKV